MATEIDSKTAPFRWVSRCVHATLAATLLVVIGLRVYAYFASPASEITPTVRASSGTASEWRDAGNSAFATEKWEEAAEAYGQLTRAEPDNVRAWVRFAYSLHATGRWDQALAAHLRVSQFPGVRPWALYNVACVYAVKNERQMALDYLQEAVEAGFRRREPIEEDPDFKSLVDDPEFKELAEFVRPIGLRRVYRQFDFLLGRWYLLGSDDQRFGTFELSQAGENRFLFVGRLKDNTRVTTSTMAAYFEPKDRVWKQVWVDEQGTVTQVAGKADIGSALVLQGEVVTADGQRELARVTYREVEGGFVTHEISVSNDSGDTWKSQLTATLVPQGVRHAEQHSPTADSPAGVDPTSRH
ncbi:MAG: hypothetical protein FJ276_24750 [Planctomycetes bacterium]|nr:hypothetical protein [Planctomycetota bacterium]